MTAEEVRAVMASEPELLALADALREKFGAKLVWLKTEAVEIGKPVRGTVNAL
jgi:hypothetical protein